MKSALLTAVILLVSSSGLCAAADRPGETFHAYVDTDICSRLMLGPINEARVGCSLSTAKDGDEPVLIRLQNNMVLTVNKRKMVEKLVGQFMQATGQVKVSDGTMKLSEVSPEQAKDIPAGDPARKLIDPQTYRTDAKLYEKIRHELAMMPYTSEFDFISFTLLGSDVIASDKRFCPDEATDHPTATVTLFRKAGAKRVEDYHGCFARSDHSVVNIIEQLRRFERMIDSTAGSARWVRPADRR